MRATRRARRETPPIWPLPGARTPAPGQPPARPRRWPQIVLVALLLLVLGTGVAFWRLSATVTSYPGAHFNVGHNAVWLEHVWAGQPHSGDEYDQLATRLRSEQIGFVFAHVGPLQSDGTIPPDLAPNASALALALHARLPGIKVLAWIGQVELAGGYAPEESVNLTDSQVRFDIAHTAARFVTDDGFDGVHYDIEPIVNNSARFLDLLDTTRTALPSGALLSVVGEKWAPDATAASVLYAAHRAGAWWTSYYYAAVAAKVDQVVAMIYDTGMPAAGLYTLTVKQETANILDAVRSARHPPQLLIGLPTYTGDSTWFHSSAENMGTGLSGVVAGLNSNRDTSAFTGVAIYRYASTSDADWQTYDRVWLGK
jgi:hypothetical protein